MKSCFKELEIQKSALFARGVTIGLAGLLSACLLTGCAACEADGGVKAESKGLPESIRHVQSYSSVLIGGPAEEFWAESDVVCCGVYRGESAPFLVDPVDGSEPCYYTDYFFEVDEVLKGMLPASASEGGEIVAVRQRGGVGQTIATVDEDIADPEPGVRYMLNLYAMDTGAEYNTAGDHYYLLGKRLGLWKEVEDDVFCRPNTGELISSEAIRDLGNSASAQVTNHEEKTGLDAYLRDVESHYLRGDIAKDVYDQEARRIEKMKSERARIVPDEEIEEAEQRALQGESVS